MNRLLSLVALCLGTALIVSVPCHAGTATYCISGTSTGVGWTFALDCLSGNVEVGGGGVSDGAVPAASPCSVLAQTFVDVVNVTGIGNWTAMVSPSNPCCFTVSNPDCPSADIRLTVTTAGTGPCTVTPTTPCSFNPTISQTGPVSTDASTWGSIKAEYGG